MNRALRFWLAVLPSFAAVATIALQSEQGLRSGALVRLELRPFDPMDALSGRYLALPLAVGQVDPSLVRDAREYHGGETVWLVLEPGEPWWRPSALLGAPPGADVVALRGRVVHTAPQAIWIDYGLDRFYIPHEGHDPTLQREQYELAALVRVAKDGRGFFADLLIDGEPYGVWNARQKR